MTVIRLLLICKIRSSSSVIGLVAHLLSLLTVACLLVILGGLCGILVEEKFITLTALQLLVVGVSFLLVLLKERDYGFLKPLCPIISRRYIAVFRLIEVVFSKENLTLAVILVPLYYVLNGQFAYIYLLQLILINLAISLIVSIIDVLSTKRKWISRLFISLIIAFCLLIVFLRTINFKVPLTNSSLLLRLIVIITAVISLALCCFILYVKNYPSLYSKGGFLDGKWQGGKIAYSSLSFTTTIIKQVLRCPAYRKLFPSVIAIVVLGVFIMRIDGLEYLGAAMCAGAYSLSMFQYSTSFMSSSVDLFFTIPRSIKNIYWSFVMINTFITTLFSSFAALYLSFVAEVSPLPVFFIWGFICVPLSMLIFINSIFPIKIDLWSNDPSLDRNPVQVVVSAFVAFVFFLVSLLIQFKTFEACFIIGIISLLFALNYKAHFSYIAKKLRQRKYIIINTLR